jgi:hypothetical protein
MYPARSRSNDPRQARPSPRATDAMQSHFRASQSSNRLTLSAQVRPIAPTDGAGIDRSAVPHQDATRRHPAHVVMDVENWRSLWRLGKGSASRQSIAPARVATWSTSHRPNASGDSAGAKRNPWTESHPSSARKLRCPSVSTPSASKLDAEWSGTGLSGKHMVRRCPKSLLDPVPPDGKPSCLRFH